MGFLTFNEKYYKERISYFENRTLSADEVLEAKQLLKLLDDLADEGYTALNTLLEEKYKIISRLRRIILDCGEIPFTVNVHSAVRDNYGNDNIELLSFIEKITSEADSQSQLSDNPLLNSIIGYCNWIGYEADTAYVFLLRDAFLPYVYFRSKHRNNLYPWIIGRAFLERITGTKNIDDDFRLPIFEALEQGIDNYNDFRAFCINKISAVLDCYPELKIALTNLLCGIPAKKIIVVESGYCGTVPMMLAAVDERVDFRLFTTAPYLYRIYDGRIFEKHYEKIRLFETLCSQDLLMKYSDYEHGRFFVNCTKDADVYREALAEIEVMTK